MPTLVPGTRRGMSCDERKSIEKSVGDDDAFAGLSGGESVDWRVRRRPNSADSAVFGVLTGEDAESRWTALPKPNGTRPSPAKERRAARSDRVRRSSLRLWCADLGVGAASWAAMCSNPATVARLAVLDERCRFALVRVRLRSRVCGPPETVADLGLGPAA